MSWQIRYNDLASNSILTGFELGNAATDFLLADDFDGDGIDDAMTWTPGDDGVFRVQRSSRLGDAAVEMHFGSSTGSTIDPVQSGDYDGDRVADFAYFHSAPFGGADGPAYLRKSSSLNQWRRVGTISTTLVGVAGDFFPIGGLDSTGDGLADLPVQTADSVVPTDGHWFVYNGALGTFVDDFVFGLSSDFILPGNHVGNAQADITLRRTVSGNREHYFRDGQLGTTSGPVVFGITGDSTAPGDYDGDGLDDLAVWRSSPTPGLSKFLVRRSATPDPVLEYVMGQAGDVPIAGFRVH